MSKSLFRVSVASNSYTRTSEIHVPFFSSILVRRARDWSLCGLRTRRVLLHLSIGFFLEHIGFVERYIVVLACHSLLPRRATPPYTSSTTSVTCCAHVAFVHWILFSKGFAPLPVFQSPCSLTARASNKDSRDAATTLAPTLPPT